MNQRLRRSPPDVVYTPIDVTSDTGSIYLHCDPTASHYLKLLMDAVFGQRHFRNEIVWAYRGGGVPQTPGQRRRIPRGRRSAPKRRLRRPRALTTRHRKGWLETPQGNYITSADPAGGHGRTTETGLSTMLLSGFLIVTAVPHTGGAAAPWSSPANGALPYGDDPDRRVNGVDNHPKESLASLAVIEADSATLNGGGRVRKPPASPRRKPTPRQRVRWKAVQQAKLRGLSIRAIARELGIHRNTVRKYAEAKSPPMMRTRGRSRVSQSDGMTAD